MMKRSLIAIFTAAFVWNAAAFAGETRVPARTPPLTDAARNVAVVLNYCHHILFTILHHRDRVILDEEYRNIVGNVRLSAVTDREIVALLQELMDTLTVFRLADAQKEILNAEYDRKVAESLYAVLSDRGGRIAGKLDSPVGTLLTVGGSVRHYRKNLERYRKELDQNLWHLDVQEIRRINDLQKTFLDVSWKMVSKYRIDETAYLLTDGLLKRFSAALADEDPQRRYRRLKTLTEIFPPFPPLLYETAKAALAADLPRETLALFPRVEAVRIPFFRADAEYAAALVARVTALKHIKETRLTRKDAFYPEIRTALEKILENGGGDWRTRFFAAMQYAGMGDFEPAQALLRRNLDEGRAVSVNACALGRVFAEFGENDRLVALIVETADDARLRFLDRLYLVGRVQDQTDRRRLLEDLVMPPVASIAFAVRDPYFGKPVFRIGFPEPFTAACEETFAVSLRPPETPDAEMISGTPALDTENQLQIFSFSGINETYFPIEGEDPRPLTVEIDDGYRTAALRCELESADAPETGFLGGVKNRVTGLVSTKNDRLRLRIGALTLAEAPGFAFTETYARPLP